MTVRAEKIAAALFAIYFAYFLKSTILDYPTEPKVIGGVDFDQPIPQVMFWSPIYYPMLLAACFAYWIWPSRSYQSLARRMAAGSFAIVRITYFTLFISFLCTGFGALYLAIPRVMTVEIPAMLASVFLSALQGTALFGVFHAMAFIPFSIIVGSLIALGAHFLTPSFGSEVRPTTQSLLTFLRSSSEWPWVSLIAGFIAATIMAAGFSQGGIFIVVFWIMNFMQLTFPYIALGAAIRYFSQQWAWCVPVSLPIAYYFSTQNARPPGLLASQSLDFPPVLFAVLLGFLIMRALARRLFAHQDASSRSFES
jgi:hypothetical protein